MPQGSASRPSQPQAAGFVGPSGKLLGELQFIRRVTAYHRAQLDRLIEAINGSTSPAAVNHPQVVALCVETLNVVLRSQAALADALLGEG